METPAPKIVLVIPSLKGGGAEKVAATLLESLRKSPDKSKIVLVLFERDTTIKSDQGLDIRYLNVRQSGTVLYTLAKFFKAMFNLAKIIRQESPCVVMSFMGYSNILSIIGNILSGGGNRVVITEHTLPTVQTGTHAPNYWEKLTGFMMRHLYCRADAVVAVSKGIRDDLVQNFGVNGERAYIIPNPVDRRKIARLSSEEISEEIFSGDTPVILSVGRLSKEKGFDYLLQAFALVRRSCKANLAILGEGKEEDALTRLSKEIGIEGSVHLLGFRDNPYKYMKRATLFVLPSLYEGFGVVLVEAMACGVPIIATRSYDGIEEIIENEKTGLLIPVADERALAESMERLLRDGSLRISLTAAANRKVTEFDVDKIVGQYRAVLGAGMPNVDNNPEMSSS